jgi:hypothetical protein
MLLEIAPSTNGDEVKLVFSLLASAAMSLLAAGPKAPGTAALARGVVIEAGSEEYVDGVGSLRRLPVITPDAIGPFHTDVSDNSRFVVVRFRLGDVSAGRLYIREMSLPPGAQLFVYGINASGVTNVYGPFTSVGPLNSGEFWTGVVVGTEIVLELQATETLPDLPFEIVGLAPADASEATPDVTAEITDSHTSIFRGVALTHAVQNGIAVFEGDIVLGHAGELPRADSQSKNGNRAAVAITGQSYRWKGGIIPYAIDPALPTPTRVTDAVTHWNTLMAGYVNWVPRTTEAAYVYFARVPSASTCASSVGMLGYKQAVSIGDSCSIGNVIHEMGHAVGLWHEQGREDRDRFVKILWENLQTNMAYNFTQNVTNGDDIGVYDYASIMHYPASGFSANGKPTIETIPPGIAIGQRGKLSTGDIAAVKAMYPNGSTEQPSVTIESIPTGQTITIDGVNYKTPRTLQWTPGSVHTVAAVNAAVVNGTRNVFVHWTDGGAQAHTVVAPTSSTTYRADYATSYAAVATAAAPGAVAVWPVSADTFYAKGSSVDLEAVAPGGYCFTSWTGLVAGTPAKTALSIQKAYTVQANFGPGSMTVSPSAVTMPTAASTRQITVDATAGCTWQASSPVTWVKVTTGAVGTGPGVVTISTTTRGSTAAPRSATLTIAGQPVVVTQ